MPIALRKHDSHRPMTNGFTVAIESHQLPALQAGHFLFTSESVGEGHPGIGALEG